MHFRNRKLMDRLSLGYGLRGIVRGAYLLGADRNLLVRTMDAQGSETENENENGASSFAEMYEGFFVAGGGEYRGGGRWAWTWFTEPAVMAQEPTLFLILEGTREEVLAEFDSWNAVWAPAYLVGVGVETLFIDAAMSNFLVSGERVWLGSDWPGPRRKLPRWSVFDAIRSGEAWVRVSTPITIRTLLRDLRVSSPESTWKDPWLTSASADGAGGVLELATRIEARGFRLAFAAIAGLDAVADVCEFGGNGSIQRLIQSADESMQMKIPHAAGEQSAYPLRISSELKSVVESGNDASLLRLVYELSLSDIRILVVPEGTTSVTQNSEVPWQTLETLRKSGLGRPL